MIALLPQEIREYLPGGYQSEPGVWLVLPEPGEGERGITAVNSWIRAEGWYPPALSSIVWFGDDGAGNFLGWSPEQGKAILWNPEDGASPWKEGTVQSLWELIQNGYQ